IYPVDLSSLPNDFTTWKTKFSTIASGSYSIKIDYFDYSDTNIIFTDEAGLSISSEALDLDFDILKSNLLIGGHNYNATAFLLDIQRNVLSQTSIDFTAGFGLYDNWDYIVDAPTSTSTVFTMTCDETSNFFENSLCHLAVFLFMPADDVLANFYTLWDTIKGKAPMGYITSAIDEYQDFSNSTSTIFILQQIPAVNTKVFNPLKTGIAWVLWFSFGIFIIKRIGKETL
ncbi:MAG: hypothetical protein ACTSPH_12290, partial [Promethearchaeota archaeon]